MKGLFSISERLSPVLVKELRQGMKTKAFSFSFMLLQALMILCVIIYLMAAKNNEDLRGVHALFWVFVGAPLLLLIPLRGFNAVNGELKANTLELMFLTRMSAFQIVAGKWTSLFFQTILFLIAILPYAVLRYFLGAVNLVDDLRTLYLMLGGSAVLTALAVGLSPFQSKLFRAGLLIGAFFALYIIPVWLISMSFSGGMSASSPAGQGTLLLLGAFAVLAILFFLELGAARIAPPAENHATRKRLIGLAILALTFVVTGMGSRYEVFYMGLIFLLPVCADALCEPSRIMASACRPFVRLRWPGRLAARALYPGWSSGLLYSLLVFTLVVVVLCLQHPGDIDEEGFQFFITLLGAMCMPLACIKLVRPESDRTMALYFGAQAIIVTLTMVLYGSIKAFGNGSYDLLALIPTSAFVLMAVFNESEDYWIFITGIVTLVSIVVLIVRSIPVWRRTLAVERGVAESLRAERGGDRASGEAG